MADDHHRPICLLLLPRPLESFLLRDQAQDLLTARGVIAVEPPRGGYGSVLRAPAAVVAAVARRQARRVLATVGSHGDRPVAVTIFHPVQAPLARAIQARVAAQGGTCELWYGRWDRYEHAYDAGGRRRARLEQLHELAAGCSDLTFVASQELARLEREAGREATLVPLAADSFPAPDPSGTVVAISLGHLGWRTDWALLRQTGERLGDRLVLLLVGESHPAESAGDEDQAWCLRHPGFVWLGRRSDEEAAALIRCADVGIVPFRVEPFNDAGLPYRILKYARLGRHTVAPDLAGAKTWSRAVTSTSSAAEFADALLAHAGRGAAPDLELRDWALAQTARSQNEPLWERLRALGVAS